jgi:hypothetical protein
MLKEPPFPDNPGDYGVLILLFFREELKRWYGGFPAIVFLF